MEKKSIYVTQPFLPPLDDFIPYLEKIWERRVLTNSGPFHEEFEKELSAYLGVEHISLFANATIALVTALQALRISGEVITTPFSFVATSHALLWNNIKPIFVDIQEDTLNIDPKKIEAAITPQTTAILPVHCYGNPCEINKIQKIADDYNLKIIYDAAHAFGVNSDCGSILNYGDLSVVSFHATKVFNTFEGGAIVSNDKKIKNRIDKLKNFGFVNETTVVATGINGKMSEFNAALGLLQLKYIDDAFRKRCAIDELYKKSLSGVKGIYFPENNAFRKNYSYFPILIKSDYPLSRDELCDKLKRNNIFPRKYFYPLISDFPMYRSLSSANKNNLPIASQISLEILCLPIYPSLPIENVMEIIEIIALT